MQKLLFEVSDGNHAALCEPVFMDDLHELPMALKQAMEDFLEAHDGEIAAPVVITARCESEPGRTTVNLEDELAVFESRVL